VRWGTDEGSLLGTGGCAAIICRSARSRVVSKAVHFVCAVRLEENVAKCVSLSSGPSASSEMQWEQVSRSPDNAMQTAVPAESWVLRQRQGVLILWETSELPPK
jgi:hypothetical protein